MRYFIAIYVIVILVVVSIMGFRGDLTENTPLEVFPDMDRQAKFKAQTANPLFADNQADRLPVIGTALRGNALEIENVFAKNLQISSIEFRTGKTADGNWTDFIRKDLEVDLALMRLGQEKYDIHSRFAMVTMGMAKGFLPNSELPQETFPMHPTQEPT